MPGKYAPSFVALGTVAIFVVGSLVLLTQGGEPVLGKKGTIKLPEKGDVVLLPDGSLQVDKVEIDKFMIVVPPNYENLSATTGSRFKYTGSDSLKVQDNPQIAQGYLERSNINLPSEMIAMIENSRAAEMAGRAMQVVDQGVGEAIRAFSS